VLLTPVSEVFCASLHVLKTPPRTGAQSPKIQRSKLVRDQRIAAAGPPDHGSRRIKDPVGAIRVTT